MMGLIVVRWWNVSRGGNMRSAPPAGWYQDPADQQELRWWDGTQWGPRAPSAAIQLPEAPEYAPAPTGLEHPAAVGGAAGHFKRPRIKGKIIGVSAAVTLVAVAVAVLLTANSNRHSHYAAVGLQASASSVASSPTSATTSSPAAAAASPPDVPSPAPSAPSSPVTTPAQSSPVPAPASSPAPVPALSAAAEQLESDGYSVTEQWDSNSYPIALGVNTSGSQQELVQTSLSALQANEAVVSYFNAATQLGVSSQISELKQVNEPDGSALVIEAGTPNIIQYFLRNVLASVGISS